MNDSTAEAYGGIMLLVILFSLASTYIRYLFKEPNKMYWVGLLSLYIQSLLWIFIVVLSIPWEFNVGQKVAAFVAVFPFVLPAFFAWITKAIAGNAVIVGLASFTFYSFVQVIVHGIVSGQERFTNKILAAIKFAVPILSLLIATSKAFMTA